MAAATAKGMCSCQLHSFPTINVEYSHLSNSKCKILTPVPISRIMAENTGKGDGSDPSDNSTELQDLKATVAKLQAENDSLYTSKSTQDNTNQFVKNLTAGITQGISQAISTQIKPVPKNKLAKQPETVELDPNLPDCYHDMQQQEKTDNVGPPISENISALLERCWRYPFHKEEIIEVLDKQVHPTNVDAIKPLEINQEVKVRMNKTDKTNKKDLRYIGNAVCTAGKCLAYLMDMLAQAETQLKSEYPEDDGWCVVDEFSFDFPKANKLMSNAMMILGMANVQTGQARRALLAPKFKQEFRRLCDKTNGFEKGMFFGLSLDSATALLSDENKVQNKTFEQKTCGRPSRRWGQNRSAPYSVSILLIAGSIASTGPHRNTTSA